MHSSEANPAPRDALRFGMFMGPFHATNLDATYALERDLQAFLGREAELREVAPGWRPQDVQQLTGAPLMTKGRVPEIRLP